MIYLQLIIFLVRDDVPIDNKTFLMIDFVNLKIKSVQSFRDTHKDKVCVCVFIRVDAHMCMSIYICTMLLKKEWWSYFLTLLSRTAYMPSLF
jgi:hypothetical protein